MLKKILLSLLLISVLIPANNGYAQSTNDLPVYIVQSGDTLGAIAQRFGVSQDDLIRANGLANPNALAVGMPLKIPGLEGISGTLVTQTVSLGETFRSVATRNQVPIETIARLNRITSPLELYAGASLVLPQDSKRLQAYPALTLEAGSTTLEAAAKLKENPWSLYFSNNLDSQRLLFTGDVVYDIQDTKDASTASAISPYLKSIQVSPLPLVQGATITFRVKTTLELDLTGKIGDRELHFVKEADNQYVALQGIYALENPGLTLFSLHGTTAQKQSFDFEEMVILKSGYFPNDPPLTVDPETIDPAVTKPEESKIAEIVKPVTPEKLWTKKFLVPVDEPVCYKSTFGNRRSYNGGPYNSFHGGTDFGVCSNLNIKAPADGVVVFAGPLTVRGNATIIDHGWGVYSGYWHQKEIKVKVGDKVKAGQIIGLIGATGRVTGPHLHWEMVVNGVQVEPVDWLEKVYPAN